MAWQKFPQLLREGAYGLDSLFDGLYPTRIRDLSKINWTPVDTARKAVELLAPAAGAKVLDVGSGIGKFCIIGSLLTDAHYVGIEQRADLVELARTTATRLGVSRAEFVQGNAFNLDWSAYSGVYLYNPFEEEYFDPSQRIDESLPYSPTRYAEYVELATEKLAEMPAGARVVLYHGFGGEMPAGYHCTWSGYYGSGSLECWERMITLRRSRRRATSGDPLRA
jgi:SAM-dependent methyltransferase